MNRALNRPLRVLLTLLASSAIATPSGAIIAPGSEITPNSTNPEVETMTPAPPAADRNLSPGQRDRRLTEYQRYHEVIQRTMQMVSDPTARSLAQRFGLDIVNITWEDTGRYQNSAVGPNISDMSIQVQQQDPRTGAYQLNLMPVIRYPNFADQSADVPLDEIYLLMGNEQGRDLERVALREVLDHLRDYLHEPDSWAGGQRSLLAPRDTHVLVSAQACFLPIPAAGQAEFNPVLFNYQSYAGNPAVLTIVATREGTSMTVIDNTRDAFAAGQTWGQRLFFNQNGERASFTGQRLSDFIATPPVSNPDDPDSTVTPESTEGMNLVLLIQVPLKQRPVARSPMDGAFFGSNLAVPAAPLAMESARSDVENAVIGHGETEGPFTEIDNLPIERDPDFPIRVTVQFYKATSNGVVSEADLVDIHEQIQLVYSNADYVGSLVVDGPSDRPTAHDGEQTEPADWWSEFWRNYEERFGRTETDALTLWRWLTGR